MGDFMIQAISSSNAPSDTSARTVVPWPGRLSIRKVPPSTLYIGVSGLNATGDAIEHRRR